jgi:hypothetical protein
VTALFRPNLPDFRKSIAFWKVLAASQGQYVQGDEYGGMILTGETERLGGKLVTVPLFP